MKFDHYQKGRVNVLSSERVVEVACCRENVLSSENIIVWSCRASRVKASPRAENICEVKYSLADIHHSNMSKATEKNSSW